MSTKKIELVFLDNQAGENEGLGHAGIETYRDAPYASVARECGQNSRDAANTTPVVMSFDLLKIAPSEYPMHSEHLATICQCLKKAQAKKDEKEIEFFERAKEVLESSEITLLRIDDSNTKGLIGPATAGTPFHSLVKSSGVSNKDSEASGGSFGIGKNAAFAVSELQSVFYSTVYEDADAKESRFLAQGKTILISHQDSTGAEKRATGYWGLPGFMPIDDPAHVPGWMQRSEIGTSVIVLGFRETEQWQYRIAESLLQNFFCAVHRDEIRFLINKSEIEIRKDTIASLFEDSNVVKAAKDADDFEDFQFAKNLYDCLTSSEAIKKTFDVKGLGSVSLTMLMREKLPKRVRIIRNGMAITDELGSFGDKFATFPMYREFVALVEPDTSDGSKFLKRLENPRHDGLSAERLADPAKRAAASVAMKVLARKIRDAIKEQALTKPEKNTALDELTEFFDDRDPADKPLVPSKEDNPEILVYTPVASAPTSHTETPEGTKGKSGGKGTHKGKGGKGSGRGGGTGAGKGGRGKKGGAASVHLDAFRNVIADPASGWSRELYFTPDTTGNVSITVFAAGLQNPTEIKVAGADRATVTPDGKLTLSTTAATREVVSVTFKEPYDGPLELVATQANAGGTP